jgi:hypothetical protein
MIRLRVLLNTTAGSVPELIKVIKFLYGSEIVHIVPDYPAGLIILHDGEGPDVDFNEIIRQVVGAGIDYSTKELFYFADELPSGEAVGTMRARADMKDYMGYVFRNGVYQRNGQIRRNTGTKDLLTIGLNLSLGDQLFGRALPSGFVGDVATEFLAFNGRMKYAETAPLAEAAAMAIAYNHQLEDVFNMQELIAASAAMFGLQDTLETLEAASMSMKKSLNDTMASSEAASITVNHAMHETFDRGIRRNGTIRRNGRYNRATGVVDVQNITAVVAPLADTLASSDGMTIGYRNHYKRDGTYRRDGTIRRDSGVLHPLED